MNRKNKLRGIGAIVILLLILPVVSAGLLHTPALEGTSGNQGVPADIPSEDITFVTTQGKEFYSGQARLVAFRTETNEPVWVHDKYGRYLDVDPLGKNRVLFIGAKKVNESVDAPIDEQSSNRVFSNPVNFYAVEMNWRTGEVLDRFIIPDATHDVDYLGGDRYAIAQMAPADNDNRAYVYDRSQNEMVWEYNFGKQHPPYPKAGGSRTGYTHLNDIDAIDNGSAFLVSPRNFDRVMLINRSTKEIEWTLGEENNYDVLNEQHNPVILSQDPLTVLVADSENNRVVEYRRTGSGWTRDWTYKKVAWPRDADRLPNGNTMIIDTRNQRAIEVTPKGRTVWSVDISFAPYDIERPPLGDEAGGPTMQEMGITNRVIDSNSTGVELPAPIQRVSGSFRFIYTTAQWVIPSWIGTLEFAFLGLAIIVAGVWSGLELSYVRQVRSVSPPDFSARTIQWLKTAMAVVSLLIGVTLLFIGIAPRRANGLYLGIGLVLLLEGVTWLGNVRSLRSVRRFLRLVRGALIAVSLLAAILLVVLAFRTPSEFADFYIGIALLIAVSLLRTA